MGTAGTWSHNSLSKAWQELTELVERATPQRFPTLGITRSPLFGGAAEDLDDVKRRVLHSRTGRSLKIELDIAKSQVVVSREDAARRKGQFVYQARSEDRGPVRLYAGTSDGKTVHDAFEDLLAWLVRGRIR